MCGNRPIAPLQAFLARGAGRYAVLSMATGRVGRMSIPQQVTKTHATGNDFVVYAIPKAGSSRLPTRYGTLTIAISALAEMA